MPQSQQPSSLSMDHHKRAAIQLPWEKGSEVRTKRARPGRRKWHDFAVPTNLLDETTASRCWLELRSGGAVSRYPGEERIVLLRSSGGSSSSGLRPEIIAKLIFSSSISDNHNQKNENEKTRSVVTSTLHVLEVKKAFRGCGLGALLIKEYLATLEDSEHCGTDGIQSVSCQLEAEEDVTRHGRLIGFYKYLGWHVKPNGKVQYLNNNDGETYRKVPMQLDIIHDTMGHDDCIVRSSSWVETKQPFFPVLLSNRSKRGYRQKGGSVSADLRMLLLPEQDGSVVFQSCQYDGERTTKKDKETTINHGCFQTLCYMDPIPGSKDHPRGKEKHWLLFQARKGETNTKRYLALGQRGLYVSTLPVLWKWKVVDNSQDKSPIGRFCCTHDTLEQRLQYVSQWSTQSVEFVQSMHKRYGCFQLAQMSLSKALLEVAKHVPWVSLEEEESTAEHGKRSSSSSLLVRCFATAEFFRRDGQPDWMQFLALLYHLGGVVKRLDPHQTTMEQQQNAESYDWTIPTQSWIVGCPPPSFLLADEHDNNDNNDNNNNSYEEFYCLNPDANDPRYNSTPRGMYKPQCGLDQTLMTWSAPEYMFHLLVHNRVLDMIPEEGLGMLRYASLQSWHSGCCSNNGIGAGYSSITNDQDAQIQGAVLDFARLLDESTNGGQNNCGHLDDEDCARLWEDRYSFVAQKFGLDGDLCW